jgi:preprotein translocase subunit SecG
VLTTVLTVIYIVVCFALIASVLLQSGRSAGLGTIAGGAQTLFGRRKGLDDKLSLATTILAVIFMLFTIVLLILG